jgi:hypothetical protein
MFCFMQTGLWICVTLFLKCTEAGVYDVSGLSYSRLHVIGYHYTDRLLFLAFLIFVAMVTTELWIFWTSGYSDNQPPTWAVQTGFMLGTCRLSEMNHLSGSQNLVGIRYTSTTARNFAEQIFHLYHKKCVKSSNRNENTTSYTHHNTEACDCNHCSDLTSAVAWQHSVS